jgi:hypothetical protein
MSIVVETGTGASNSETYISVADASTYHTARGNAAWAALASDTVREQALRKATGYMVATYRNRWQGTRKVEDQALCWPRYSVVVEGYLVDDDIVPEIVKRACAELALKAAAEDLAPDLEQVTISQTVGPIRTDYDRYSPQWKRYRAIDAMLLPYLKSGGAGSCVGLVRG